MFPVVSFLALFGLGGGEIILVLSLFLILLGARWLPAIAQRLGKGVHQFGDAVDQETHQAGESLGGIYGKPASQALTAHNQVAELYDPAVFRKEEKRDGFNKQVRFLSWSRLCKWVRSLLSKWLKNRA